MSVDKSVKPTIMLVDDKPENLVVLEASLKKLDAKFVCFESGKEALTYLLSETGVALIFMDVQMPEMDGFETAQFIREREATKTIPIIFVTAINKDERYVFQGYESGAVDYLCKPLDMRLLRSKARVFLDLYSQRMQILEQQASLLKYERSLIRQRHNSNLAQFINGIAHNFNNLLAGVRGYGQLVQLYPDNVQMAEKAGNQIMEGVDKLTKLVKDLRNLVLSNEDDKTILDIKSELQEIIELIKSTMSSRIIFQYEIDDFNGLHINMSQSDFRASFSSLIVNAIEAVNNVDAPQIDVHAYLDKKNFVLTVTDNGKGMSDEVLSQATVPLFSTKNLVGVGMGLAQVKSFCNLQEGNLHITSNLNVGTQVTITLPV